MMHDCTTTTADMSTTGLPAFVAYKLSRLPSIDLSHIDVTVLNKQIYELQEQVNAAAVPSSVLHELTNMKCQMSAVSNGLHELMSRVESLSTQLAHRVSPSSQSVLSPFDSTNAVPSAVAVTVPVPIPSAPPSFAYLFSANSQHSSTVISTTSVTQPVSTTAAARTSSNHISDQDASVSAPISTNLHTVDTVDATSGSRVSGNATLVTSQPDGASPITDDDGFVFPRRHRNNRRQKKPVIGTRSIPARLQSLQMPPSTKTLFVSRLPPTATEADLREFMYLTFKLHATCVKVASSTYHCSFKVTVSTAFPRLLYDSTLWPKGALVRKFFSHGTQSQ